MAGRNFQQYGSQSRPELVSRDLKPEVSTNNKKQPLKWVITWPFGWWNPGARWKSFIISSVSSICLRKHFLKGIGVVLLASKRRVIGFFFQVPRIFSTTIYYPLRPPLQGYPPSSSSVLGKGGGRLFMHLLCAFRKGEGLWPNPIVCMMCNRNQFPGHRPDVCAPIVVVWRHFAIPAVTTKRLIRSKQLY
jgi:hypothetical protein